MLNDSLPADSVSYIVGVPEPESVSLTVIGSLSVATPSSWIVTGRNLFVAGLGPTGDPLLQRFDLDAGHASTAIRLPAGSGAPHSFSDRSPDSLIAYYPHPLGCAALLADSLLAPLQSCPPETMPTNGRDQVYWLGPVLPPSGAPGLKHLTRSVLRSGRDLV